jgi:hypothetical protein
MKGNAIERCWKRFMVADREFRIGRFKNIRFVFDEGFIKITGKGINSDLFQ